MKQVLKDIQTGEYAKSFILENRAGAPTLLSRRRLTSEHSDRGRGREAARHDALDQGQQAGRQEPQLTAGPPGHRPPQGGLFLPFPALRYPRRPMSDDRIAKIRARRRRGACASRGRAARASTCCPTRHHAGGAVLGFYGIVMAMNGRFEAACIGIFCAVLDSLDGRVARMTNSQSAFGEQMDSLCDMVSFGAAPALIVYEWALKDLGKLGWIPAFVYIAGAALRWRASTSTSASSTSASSRACPARRRRPGDGAHLGDGRRRLRGGQVDWLAWTAFGVTLYAGLTMVTNAPFYSFKDVGDEAHRALRRDRGHRAGHRADQPGPADGAVRAVLRLRPVGLRGLRLAQVQGQAGPA
jgi:phosphatidylserine synthase